MPILGANSPEQFRLLEFINAEGFKKGPEWEIASIDYLAQYIRDLDKFIRNPVIYYNRYILNSSFRNLNVYKNIEICTEEYRNK
jgi:hypothetical protein